MRKKLMTIALAAGLVFGGAPVALAGPGDNGKGPDPGGPAKKGLCTAYFNGQKKGHGKNGNPPPFRNLETAAEDADQSVYEYCGAANIGGNPGENGRFTECFDGDDGTGNDACPTE